MPNRPTVRTEDKFQTKSALHEHVRQMFMLERLCSRFHLVAQQLHARHDHRATLHVEDEHDVHDLLRALLTLEHDDVRIEEWTPSYAPSPRQDFVLQLAHIVTIAKMTRRDWGAQALAEQLAVDAQKYRAHPDCKTLVCFVYDPDGHLADARQIEHALSGEKDGLAVRVIIAPKSF